ncbi:MAG TPA: RimK/LysX family protein [Verrucomicrobiae bacterium]|nr:RimK/LysX family protein [Verrucomicrobiae bacterium]
MKQQVPPKIISTFEPVGFPDFGVDEVKAKIDTGAYTGALHCTNIRVEKSEAGKVLHFSPLGDPAVDATVTEFAVRYVRSSNGDNQKRYFIKTRVIVRGQTYPIAISLADRSEMRWPVLIGRRFLRHHHFLVDVGKRATYGEPVEE